MNQLKKVAIGEASKIDLSESPFNHETSSLDAGAKLLATHAERARMSILGTRGAGYIGSHTCVGLLSADHEVIVLDNFNHNPRIKQAAQNENRNKKGRGFNFCIGHAPKWHKRNHPGQQVMNVPVLRLTKDQIDARCDDFGDFIDQLVKALMIQLAFAVIAHVGADVLVLESTT